LFFSPVFFLSGCVPIITQGPKITIDTEQFLDEPKEIQSNFAPINAAGKETVTKGTSKTTSNDSFLVNYTEYLGVKAVEISKDNIKVSIMHASFDFLKDNFGIDGTIQHSLGATATPIHVWGPTQTFTNYAYYSASSTDPYQSYTVVPFHNCITDVYRNENNRATLERFREAFYKGEIKPILGDIRTPQEIKTQVEQLIGQVYCSEYYKSNIVFHIKIEQFGEEKIRLWPTSNSVIVDSHNNQYKALPELELDSLLKSWNERVANLPKGKENPVLGITLSNREGSVVILSTVTGLSAEKAGLTKGDIILNVNDKKITSASDVLLALGNKVPGDVVNVNFIRNTKENSIQVNLMSADDWPKPVPIRTLAGGNIYPNVIYDGFLVFDAKAMFNNYTTGSVIKLIIPLIGTEFTASDEPIHSFEFEFDFKML